MTTALVWFRRDLRLADNPALRAALDAHDRVIPVYIHAPEEEQPWAPGAASRWWLHQSLDALDGELRARGSRLIRRQGDTLGQLGDLINGAGACAVYFNRLYEPAVRKRDRKVCRSLESDDIVVGHFPGHLMREPDACLKDDGEPYRVFTPFYKRWRQQPPAEPLYRPQKIPGPSRWPRTEALGALDLMPEKRWYEGIAEMWRPGEAGATARVDSFRDRIEDYGKRRDFPADAGVSRLSPHLHFGEITPRQLAARLPLRERGGEAFYRQLAWRDFGHQLLFHFPHTDRKPLREEYEEFPWRRNYTALLKAWQAGRTGYDMVDAGMRELWHTGYLHNRSRMIVASFLTKNLRIPWQRGARWFWDTLVDADLANNTLGWQWAAGCGADAAPYFRIFNPERQAERFDPDGKYRARWLDDERPDPVVDYRESRAQALAAWEAFQDAR